MNRPMHYYRRAALRHWAYRNQNTFLWQDGQAWLIVRPASRERRHFGLPTEVFDRTAIWPISGA